MMWCKFAECCFAQYIKCTRVMFIWTTASYSHEWPWKSVEITIIHHLIFGRVGGCFHLMLCCCLSSVQSKHCNIERCTWNPTSNNWMNIACFNDVSTISLFKLISICLIFNLIFYIFSSSASTLNLT